MEYGLVQPQSSAISRIREFSYYNVQKRDVWRIQLFLLLFLFRDGQDEREWNGMGWTVMFGCPEEVEAESVGVETEVDRGGYG